MLRSIVLRRLASHQPSKVDFKNVAKAEPFIWKAFGVLSTALTVGGVFYLTMPPADKNVKAHQNSHKIRDNVWLNANVLKRNAENMDEHHESVAQESDEAEIKKEVEELTPIDHTSIQETLHKIEDKIGEAVVSVKKEFKKAKGQVEHLVGDAKDAVEDVIEDVAKKMDHKVSTESVSTIDVSSSVQPSSIGNMITTTYLLVGGGSASYSAMKQILDLDPKADILIVTNEQYVPYMRPPLSKELWSTKNGHDKEGLTFLDWGGTERSIFYEQATQYETSIDNFENSGMVKLIKGRSVVALNPDTYVATLDNGQLIKYSKILLATGGRPKELPQMKSLAQSRLVSTYRNIDDLKRIMALVNDGDKQILIIGGGFLGSELSCAISRYGKSRNVKVTQIMPEDGNMGLIFPQYLVKWTISRVQKEGVKVLPKTQVKEASVVDGHANIKLSNGTHLVADHVIVCIGIEPNVELARSARLEIDELRGGILVNSQLEASKNIFAAGDVASFHDVTLGRRRIEHHDHAILSGRLAGRNMVGTKTSKQYKHQSMFWSDLGPEIGYEAVGILDAKLKTIGLWAKASPYDTPANALAEDQDNIRSGQQEKLHEEDPKTVERETANEVEAVLHDRDDIDVDKKASSSITEDQYGKGVVFYVDKNRKIVGVLLWNMFNRTNIARRIIADGRTADDIKDLAALFKIHDDE